MKRNKYVSMFFSPFEEPELATGGDETPAVPAAPAKESLTVPVSSTPAGVDLDALAAKFGDVVKQAMPQPKPEARPAMTAEEAKKLLNLWEPDDTFMQKFGDMTTQKEALLAMRDGMTKQMFTIMQSMLAEREADIHGRYAPLLTDREAAQQEKILSSFNSEYPALAKPELAPLISAVSAGLAGRQFASQKEGFAELARGVEAVIKSHNPDFTLTGAAAPQTKQEGQRPRVPVSSGGAGAGGGAQGNGSAKAGNGSKLSEYL